MRRSSPAMKKFLLSLLPLLVGLLLSVGVGVYSLWGPLKKRIERTVYDRAQQRPNELRKSGWDWWTVEMENLTSDLKEQKALLAKQADELELRRQRVIADEKQLAKVRAELQAMQKDISDRVVEMSADEAVNLRKLSQVYANLTPAAVVAIIREMDDTTAVKILSLMKPDVIGPIFEQMSQAAETDGAPLARRAAILSEKIRLMKASKAPAGT